MGRKGSKRITRCILNIFLPESSVSASSVSTAVSVASSESSSVKSVLSLSISSFDSRSLSSSKEKKIQVYLGRSPWGGGGGGGGGRQNPPPPPPPESCSSHWYFKKAEKETRPSCLSQRHLGSLLLGRAGQLLANCPPSIFFNIKRRLKVQNC